MSDGVGILLPGPADFSTWRQHARRLLAAGIAPEQVEWHVAGEMPGWVQEAVLKIDGITKCDVNLVFDPAWDPSRMSDEAKLQLNMF